ncbi:MAG: hypothetical protein ACXWC3_24495 [Burkholderiales bacterium]
MNPIVDLFFAFGQFIACTGLLYGMVVCFANWRESRHFWGDFDPILAYELRPVRDGQQCFTE